ncbi:MAG: hydrogenase maturation nickel metallochaperone HypA [Phycisphaerales bacterium]|jgi:hydrogenase nickel incorporation protein HypA/HybF|nr:hydrogenase maturation nickel metallochaperone HypA [Phycisphaerales bacterium]
MHELPIAQGILERVLKAAADANAARVTRIHIIIGDLSGVSAECVEFYWDSLSRGTPAHGATFHVRRVPFEMTCLDCANAFNPAGEALAYDCPACGSARVRTTHGQECCLEAIDIETPDDATPGRDPATEPRATP